MSRRTLSRTAKRLDPFLNLPRKAITGGGGSAITAHSNQEYDAAHGTNAATARVHHSIKYGILGGVGVDESANLETMIDTVGLAGGGKIIVRAALNGDPIQLDDLAGIYHSNIDIEFQSPILSGAGGGVRAMGAMDEYVRAPATFAGGLHASHPASVGDTTIYLSSTAGKMQASDYLPGDLVTIRGENNAAGEALTKQIITILSVNAGANTITFAEELEYDFEPTYPLSAYGSTDATTIFLNRTWSLTTDLVRGAMTATVSDSTGMAVGDMVRVSDSRVEIDLNPAAYRSGGAGPYENECRLEYRIITYIDSGTDTVTFDKPISKGYLQGSPYFGNLAKVLPVENVHIRGINLTYYEVQTDRNIHAISLNFAKDSTIEDCNVNGIDGGMGQQYRISDSYNCWGYRSIGRDPLYHDSAEGYIFALYKSDASGWRHCLASGGRHNFLVQAATNFTIDSCQSYDSWISGIDTHGVDEYDGLITNCLMSQMNKHAPGVSNGACARNGNTSHTVGSHWIVWQNCVFFGNPETSIYGLDVLAASTHVIIDSCKFFGGDYGIRNSKNPSQCTPTQTVSDLTIRDCEFHNIAVRPIYLEGIPDTAAGTRSSGKLDYVLLDGNTTWNCAQHFHVSGGDAITNLTVSRNRAIRPVTSPANDYYGLVITDVDGLMVDGNNFHLCSRGISGTDITNACIIGNTLTATIDATPITLAGTNTGPGGGTLINVANIVDNTSVVGTAPTLTGAAISDTAPRLVLIETDGAANNKRWHVMADGEQFKIQASADGGGTSTSAITIDRTLNVIDSVAIGANAISLIGATTATGTLATTGNAGIGTSTLTDRFNVVASGTGGATITAATAGKSLFSNGHQLLLLSSNYTGGLGFLHGANGIGIIQAYQAATEDGILSLNRNGGNVGINTDNVPYNLFIRGDVAKGTTTTETVFGFGSANTPGTDDLLLYGRVGNHATAGSRWAGFGAYENGVGGRLLWLQDLGGNTKIGTSSSDNTEVTGDLTVGDALAVTGNLTVNGHFGTWTAPTLSGTWANVGGSDSAARYRRVGDIVYLEGFVARSGTTGFTLFTLPSDCEPVLHKTFATIMKHGGSQVVCRLEVNNAGVVNIQDPLPAAAITYVMLDGIQFSTT